MVRNQVEEKKPLLFRDGVLFTIAAVGSGVCFFLTGKYGDSDLATALNAWGWVLGVIAALILIGKLTDKKRKKVDM